MAKHHEKDITLWNFLQHAATKFDSGDLCPFRVELELISVSK